MKKYILCFFIVLMLFFSTSAIYATDDWWGPAYNFINKFNGNSTQIGDTNVGTVVREGLGDIIDTIKVIGNMVFVAVTVILGVKYIWGGVESKASVKDSLVTLVVAAIVFYGWNTISNVVFLSRNNIFFITNSAENTAGIIYTIVMTAANFLAIGGLVYIGVRYMFAGAEGRAELKAKGVPIVLGIVMVYATFTFLSFIINSSLSFVKLY